MKKYIEDTVIQSWTMYNYIFPENIHMPPKEGFLVCTHSHHLLSGNSIFVWVTLSITFIQKIGLLKPPFPLEFLLTFPWAGMDIFWNYTICQKICSKCAYAWGDDHVALDCILI